MLIYLHGFNSAPQSIKVNQLRSHLATTHRENELVCPNLPWNFVEAIQTIEANLLNLKSKKICLIGSSLGGFYATYFAEKENLPAVLVNPAITPHKSLVKYLGLQKNIYSGEQYFLKEEHMDELSRFYCPVITNPTRYLLLAGVRDEILDYREAVEKFAGSEHIIVEEDHAFLSFPNHIDKVLEFADRHAGPD